MTPPGIDPGTVRIVAQRLNHYAPYLYFNNYILLRPENLYVILARHNELPDVAILNVETCSSMLFVVIIFDIVVQSLVKIVNNDGIVFGSEPITAETYPNPVQSG